MGFFSELKSDLSSAVNTVKPEEENAGAARTAEAPAANEGSVDLDSMLDRLDDIKIDDSFLSDAQEEPIGQPDVKPEAPGQIPVVEESIQIQEKITQSGEERNMGTQAEEAAAEAYEMNAAEAQELQNTDVATDETASITAGMVITGDVQTTGSLELIGKVLGNVSCNGKLNITGEVQGDSSAAEIYAENAHITGEMNSRGSVKVGQSTVIIGNIFATSAVIAGAIKGDIDVRGPVVLDTTAIVMGNIKSQSVQINNGAVIEGMCSQTYAEVNPAAFFEGLKK